MWGSHARSGAQGRVNRVPREKPAARAAPENCPNLRENGRKTPRPLGSLRGSIHLGWADAIHDFHIFSNFFKGRVVCVEIEVSLQGPVNPEGNVFSLCLLSRKKDHWRLIYTEELSQLIAFIQSQSLLSNNPYQLFDVYCGAGWL